MRHAHMMGAREPLMPRLVPVLVRQMGAAYPEIVRAEALATETLRLEETRFRSLLERGLGLLAEETGRLGSGQALPGEVAFRLYDTYGFPLDLTQDALRAEGRAVDVAGFEAAMAEQRRRARAAWAGSGEAATEGLWFDVKERVGATEFLGYSTETAEGEILAVVADGQVVERAPAGTEVAVVLNQTPFYAESGGQVGDAGLISAGEACRIVVRDTQKKLGDLFVHLGTVAHGEARPGLAVQAEVDHERRSAIRAHHSATHLLHEALRRRLGEHVAQKGSLNAPDRLRFDVSQPTPMRDDDLAWVEGEVNGRIRENAEVVTRLMTPEAAVEAGATALFGEKYGDEVRVVGMGHDPAAAAKRGVYSLELCGGTHVKRTGDIGLFKIVSEGAVSAGVRRVEAVTGEAALRLVEESDRRLREAAAALRASPAEVPGAGGGAAGGPAAAGARVGGVAQEARHRRRRGRSGGCRRAQGRAAQRGRGAAARPQGPGRRDPEGRRGGRGGAGLHGGGQGFHRGGGGRGGARPGRCGGAGARRQCGGGRQRRRRAAGDGAGRRTGCRQGGGGAGGGEGSAGLGLGCHARRNHVRCCARPSPRVSSGFGQCRGAPSLRRAGFHRLRRVGG